MAAALLFKHRRLLVSLPRQKGGKTELGVRISHNLTMRPFTSSGLFLAKDKKSGKKATREKFERIFDKSKFVVNTEQVYLKACPTSSIFMDSVDKDPDRIRGGTYSWIHWSEVAFSKIEKGETIISVFDKVVQPTLIETDGFAYLESTNNGKNGWYELWENAEAYGFHTLRVGLSDMVHLGLVTPEEYDRLQATTHPDTFRQEYECEWVTFQGKVYAEFDSVKHVDKDMAPPKEWMTVIGAIDWGYLPSATCVLFAYVVTKEETDKFGEVQQRRILHVFDELYATEELAAITADRIRETLARWRIKRFAMVADHEPDRIEELTRRNIPCRNAQKADILGTRMQGKELFYFDNIRIHPRCENLLRDLDAAVWDVKKQRDGEIDYKQCTWGHFDAEAAFRYLIRELGEVEAEAPPENPYAAYDSASAAAYDIERRIRSDYPR